MDSRPCGKPEIAERFKALRRQFGLTQSRLGKLIGICRQSISEIENACVTPHDSTWDRFCEHESRGQEPGIEHLPEHYWRDCLLEDELAEKGDTS
jgi:DNA-binding XRE family transcriptional regulator